MAVGIHVARVGYFNIDSMGNVIDKSDVNTTIGQVAKGYSEHRIISDSSIPNSVNKPTIEDYLAAEAADNYVLAHISQNIIVTYLRNSLGGYPAP